MKARGLIFDLDGTLLDSMPVWESLGQNYLRSKGIAVDEQLLKQALAPFTLLEAARYFIDQYGLALDEHYIVSEIDQILASQYLYTIPLKPGVKTFLEKHRHLPMCVATASQRCLVEQALKRLEIDRYFSFTLTCSEAGRSKQDPQLFLQAVRQLGLQPDEVIVFEDAPHAIRTAKEAGLWVVGVKDPAFAQYQKEIQQIADCYVDDLLEVEVSSY